MIASVKVVGFVRDESAVLELIDQFKLDFGGERQAGHRGDALAVHPLGNTSVSGSADGRGDGRLRKASPCAAEGKKEDYEPERNAHCESSQSGDRIRSEYSIRGARLKARYRFGRDGRGRRTGLKTGCIVPRQKSHL